MCWCRIYVYCICCVVNILHDATHKLNVSCVLYVCISLGSLKLNIHISPSIMCKVGGFYSSVCFVVYFPFHMLCLWPHPLRSISYYFVVWLTFNKTIYRAMLSVHICYCYRFCSAVVVFVAIVHSASTTVSVICFIWTNNVYLIACEHVRRCFFPHLFIRSFHLFVWSVF